jgi:hypothetical protein
VGPRSTPESAPRHRRELLAVVLGSLVLISALVPATVEARVGFLADHLAAATSGSGTGPAGRPPSSALQSRAIRAPASVADEGGRRPGTLVTGLSGTVEGRVVDRADPVRADRSPSSAPDAGWSGINASECHCEVPDPGIAVGEGEVVEFTVAGLDAWSTGGTWLGNLSSAVYFGASGLEQPAITFDNFTSQWFSVAVDPANRTLVVAATLGSQPTGPRFVYYVPSYPNMDPELPTVDASEWMVGIATNDANSSTGALAGTGYVLLNRTDLLTGVLAYYDADPMDWLPNGHADDQLTLSDSEWFGGVTPVPPPGVAFWVRWSDAPPALPVSETAGPSIASISSSPPASQPGTSDLLNTSGGNDARVDSSLWQNALETLVFSTGSNCPAAASCVDLVQVNTTLDALRQELTLGSTTFAVFDPSVGADARGDLFLTSVISSSSVYPSVVVWGQAWNEPNSTTGAYQVAAAGGASFSVGCNASGVCPFGWESAAASDPSSDKVWSVAEYTAPDGNWSTWIQSSVTTNASISLVASPAHADLGQSVELLATTWGGSGSIDDFRWYGLPLGCAAGGGNEIDCRPLTVGSFTVEVVANDSYPTDVSATARFSIAADPVVSPPLPNVPGADAGQERSFSTVADYGLAPYSFEWSGVSLANCTNTTSAVLSCYLTVAGNLSVAVTATDSAGDSVRSSSISYLVAPTLRFVGFDARNTTGRGGPSSPVSFSAAASGGAAPLNFSWSGLPGPCAPAYGPEIVCDPSASGTYNISVEISDSNGARVRGGPFVWRVPGSPASAAAPGPSGLPGYEGWLAAAALAGVVLLAVVVVLRAPPAPKRPSAAPPEDDRF